MLLVSQALPDQFLGHRDRQLADVAPEFFARATHVGVHLGPRRVQEPLRLGARGLDEAPLLVRRLLQRLGADRGGFGVSRTEPRLVLRLLARRLGARGLRLLERLLDGLGAFLHLRQEGPVEEPRQDHEEDDEVDELDD